MCFQLQIISNHIIKASEIKFSMEKKLHLTFLAICLGIISASLSFFSINLYNSLYEDTEQYHQLYDDLSYYKTADNFVGEAEKKFEKDTNKFIKLKECNKK